jgi:hypothetical protein
MSLNLVVLYLEDMRSPPPHAASTCSHTPCFSQISATNMMVKSAVPKPVPAPLWLSGQLPPAHCGGGRGRGNSNWPRSGYRGQGGRGVRGRGDGSENTKTRNYRFKTYFNSSLIVIVCCKRKKKLILITGKLTV